MLELHDQIREYLDEAAPPVPLEEVMASDCGDSDGAMLASPAGAVRPKRSARVLAGLATAAFVVALVLVVTVMRYRDGDLGPATSGATDPTYVLPSLAGPCSIEDVRPPTDSNLQAAYERSVKEAQDFTRSTGWSRYSGTDPSGQLMCGWIHHGDQDMEYFKQLAAGGGDPIFDAVDGNVIGYSFPALGFVSREVAEAPGFDPHALRVERFGCDPLEHGADCPGG